MIFISNAIMSRHFRQKSIIAKELKYSCKALIAIEAVLKTGFRLHNAHTDTWN